MVGVSSLEFFSQIDTLLVSWQEGRLVCKNLLQLSQKIFFAELDPTCRHSRKQDWVDKFDKY